MNKRKSFIKKIKRLSRRNKKPIHNKNFSNTDINQYLSNFLDLKSLTSFSNVNKDLKTDLKEILRLRKYHEHLLKPSLKIITGEYSINNFKEGDIIEFPNPNGFNFVYQIFNKQFFQLIPPNLMLPLKYDIKYLFKNYYKFNLPIPIPINELIKSIINVKIENDLSITIKVKDLLVNNKISKITSSPFNNFQEINNYFYNLLNINQDFFVYIDKNINVLKIINNNIYKLNDKSKLIIKNLENEEIVENELIE